MNKSLKEQYLSIIFAFVVGIIFLAPSIIFIVSLGDDYHGIPMMATANEDSYLARIQEILDGHPLLGSSFFYEYKDEWPLTPPTGELLYAIPSMVFNISPANIIIISRFFLAFILFLLLYHLIYQLTVGEGLSRKINSVAGALLVTLGYDLVDYRSIISFFTEGQPLAGNFLLWARPVNPIIGAIFLMSFFLFIWGIIQGKNNKKNIIGASIFLALMIASYFFSWGIAVSVLAMLILIYFFKKEYQTVKNLIFVPLLAFVLATPYWYIVWQASKSPWYEESILRSGLFLTHYPLLNKLVVATLAAFVFVLAVQIIKDRTFSQSKARDFLRILNGYMKDWHWFLLAFIFGSLWAYNQQIITGQTIWPYHFVQYSIPLVMIAVMVLFYNVMKNWSVYLWRVGVFIIVSISLLFGIYTQASVYRASYDYYAQLQFVAPLFDWLNNQEKDCVVMVVESLPKGDSLNFLIPAFTHCNTYSSNNVFSIMPNERTFHNYLSNLAFRGVSPSDIEKFLDGNLDEAKNYLFSNWKGVYGPKDFPDFSDLKLNERINQIPEAYRQFMENGLKNELWQYRLDYILSDTILSEALLSNIPGLEIVFQTDNIFIYSLKK